MQMKFLIGPDLPQHAMLFMRKMKDYLQTVPMDWFTKDLEENLKVL